MYGKRGEHHSFTTVAALQGNPRNIAEDDIETGMEVDSSKSGHCRGFFSPDPRHQPTQVAVLREMGCETWFGPSFLSPHLCPYSVAPVDGDLVQLASRNGGQRLQRKRRPVESRLNELIFKHEGTPHGPQDQQILSKIRWGMIRGYATSVV